MKNFAERAVEAVLAAIVFVGNGLGRLSELLDGGRS